MKRPAIFFDRDNTLIVSDDYLGDPEKVVLMDGAATAVARARAMGFATIVISNQSGVARGRFGTDAVDAVNKRMDQMLLTANRAAVIDRHEYCPHHPEGPVEEFKQVCECRKPKPGMILDAAEKMALDVTRSWVIGDAPRDIQAGRAAGCRTILLQTPGVPQSPAAAEKLTTPPDYMATSLSAAMDFIQQHAEARPSTETPATAVATPRIPVHSAPVTTETPSRLEHLAEMILLELRKRSEHTDYTDFSVSKLLAGIIQVLTLALLFISYLNRNDASFNPLMLTAIFLQIFTISLLVMGKQK